MEQKPLREKYIYKFMEDAKVSFSEINAVVSRGGLINPLESGTYEVNDLMYSDLKGNVAQLHASALGGMLAYEIGRREDIPCYVVDPVVVDEMDTRARLTGMPGN